MLKKFNKLFQKIIFEQVEEQEESEKFVQSINDCDSFFQAYIVPLADKLEILANKARYNVFRLQGETEKLIAFFNAFKVDKQFMPDKIQFNVLNPLITLGENKHYYNRTTSVGNASLCHPNHINIGTEGETLNTYIDDRTQDAVQNMAGEYVFGKWFDLLNYDEIKSDIADGGENKYAEPKTIAKSISKFFKKMNLNPECYEPYIEFTVNVDKLPLNSYEELAKAIPLYNINTNQTLSDTINSRHDVLNPKPNEGVLGTVKTSAEPIIMKEVKKSNTKRQKVKTKDFNKKNKVSSKTK